MKKATRTLMALFIAVAMIVTLIPPIPAHAATDSFKLTVKSGEWSEIKGSWTKPDVTGVSYYKVLKAKTVDGKRGNFVTYEKAWGSSFEDWDVTVGKKYHYKIAAYNKNDVKLAESNIVSFVAKLEKSTMRIIGHDAATGYPKIFINKGDGVNRVAVYRSKSKTGTYTKIGTTTTEKFTDKEAKSGVTYYYKVQSVKDGVPAANSALSGYRTGKKVKAEPKLATAIKESVNSNGYIINILTLDKALKLVSTANISNLSYYDGGQDLTGRKNNVPLSQVYNLSKIKAAGGGLYNAPYGGLGDPYYTQQEYLVKKNGITYEPLTGRCYGIKIIRVEKGSTTAEINAKIKKTARKYYSTANWTVTSGKYNPSKVKYSREVNGMIDCYRRYVKKAGYGKYVNNTYFIQIKNKNNSSKKSWAFVTAVPTL